VSPKPEVVLEFDLADVQFMRLPAAVPPGSTPIKETLLLVDSKWPQTLAIYAVIDGVRVVPIAIPTDAKVEIVVSR